MIKRITNLTLFSLLLAVVLFACGRGGEQKSLSFFNLSESPLANGDEAESPSIAGTYSFPSVLPSDAVQPWEKVDEQGFVIPSSSRFSSSLNLSTDFTSGVERFNSFGDVTDYGDASRLTSGEVGQRQLSYALYRISLGASQPGVVSSDINLHRKSDGSISEYWLAVSDYRKNAWKWFGPFSDSHVRLSLPSSDYTSPLGNCFIGAVAFNGSAFDVVGIGINVRDDADITPPPASSALSATPIAGGVLLEWTPVIAEDLAGYKIYYSTRDFSSPSERGVKSLSYLEGRERKFISGKIDRFGGLSKGQVFRISAIDISGNESDLSPSASASPLDGNSPAVNLETDVVSGGRGTIANLQASGAELYDFDLDGDGDWEITDDTSGLATAPMDAPGIIHPEVRGRTAEGGIAFAAVSLIISVNSRPVASAQANPSFGTAPLTVNFTGTGQDLDGTITSYSWDFDGNGFYDYTDPVNPNPPAQIYPNPGLYNVKFRVQDNAGAWDVDTIAVQVIEGPSPEEQMEEANRKLRSSFIYAVQASQRMGVDLGSSPLFGIETAGRVMSAPIAGVDTKTIDDLASGADVLFTFLNLPQGSELPSGFYIVRLSQTSTGNWVAQFIDETGTPGLETDVGVYFGNKERQRPYLTFEFGKDPKTNEFFLKIDIEWKNVSAETRIALGSGDIDPTPLSPEGRAIVDAMDTFSTEAWNILSSLNGNISEDIVIASREDALVAYSPLKGVENFTPDDYLNGQDVAFSYVRTPSGHIIVRNIRRPLNIRRSSNHSEDTRAVSDLQQGAFIVIKVKSSPPYAPTDYEAEWIDRYGNLVAVNSADVGEGVDGDPPPPPLSFALEPDYLNLAFYYPLSTVTITSWEWDETEVADTVELDNSLYRAGVASALQDVAGQLRVAGVNMDNFISIYRRRGGGWQSIWAVGTERYLISSLLGVENLTPTDMAEGVNFLLIYLNLPQGSEVPSGFYLVRIFQEAGTPNWKAELIDLDGTVQAVVDATVNNGDPREVAPVLTAAIDGPSWVVKIGWQFSGSSGEFSILMGDGEPETRPLSPEELKIQRYADAVNPMPTLKTKRPGRKVVSLVLFSRDDTLIDFYPIEGVEELSLEELRAGQDVFFGYFRVGNLPPGFYVLDYKDIDGDGAGYSRFKDLYDQTRKALSAQDGGGIPGGPIISSFGGLTKGKMFLGSVAQNWSLRIEG